MNDVSRAPWRLDLRCPMSDGAGIRVEYDGQSDSVAFWVLDMDDENFDKGELAEHRYIAQTKDLDGVIEFFQSVLHNTLRVQRELRRIKRQGDIDDDDKPHHVQFGRTFTPPPPSPPPPPPKLNIKEGKVPTKEEFGVL